MTQTPETLAIMDGTTTTTSFGKTRGFLISRGQALVILCAFVVSLIITGLLVHFLSSCRYSSSTPSCGGIIANTERTPSVILPKISTTSPSTSTTIPTHSTYTTVVTSTEENPLNVTQETKSEKIDVRLPRSILPDSYDLKLIPFISEGNFTYNGDVKIVLNVTEKTNNITLHTEKLKINDSITIHHRIQINKGTISEKSVSVSKCEIDDKRQFLIIHLKDYLLPGQQYILRIYFVGVLNDHLQGFYRSSYMSGNQTRWIAATQFQPTDARRVFPCFDEPALKARFKIHLARPSNMTSLSNMPQVSASKKRPVEGLPDYVWDEYEESVPMSTYLVAFVVCDFEKIGNETFSVWARSDALSQATYSLSIGPDILNYFEKYFRIKFPLPKIDMIALPDFAAGAMENWGLITYRETALLYQEGVSTSLYQQRIATVVSHELAHQWFGNLVTPSWWTDLWLNEGFASYVEYIGVDAVEPKWKVLDQFVAHELQLVFALDALESSHQISIEVGHPDEINEIFDRISYTKGASIIRMMDHFLTTDVFKKGLTNYLNNRKYSSATQNDLWEALTKQAHEDKVLDANVTVEQIMGTWTLQTGYPVVTINRDYDHKVIKFKQERFLLIDKTSETDANPPLWWIPITMTTQEKLDFKNTKSFRWMRGERDIILENNNVDPMHWIIVNIQETGYYRVNYDQRNWNMLISYLRDKDKFQSIAPTNRAQLLDDALNLARAGLLDYGIALNVTTYLINERNYVPWKSAFVGFGYLESMFVKTGGYEKFKSYLMKLISGLYDDIGFNDDPKDDQLTVFKRVEVLHWACLLSHTDCIRQSVTQFQNWMLSPDPDRNNPISPNLKNVVYCAALRVGGEEEWNFAWERYTKTNVGSEKEILMSAMGCTRETWILTRYLDWSLTENSGVRKQDTPRVFAAVSTNVIGQQLAFNIIRNEWNRIRNYLGTSLTTINSIIRTSTRFMNTAFERQDLEEFTNRHRLEYGTASRTLEQAIENADANIQWMHRNYKTILDWMTNVKTR